MTVINPYLNFNGNTEEVFNFYKSVFGGEFAMVMRFGEMPGCDEMKFSQEAKNKIMHIALPISGHSVLMGSDYVEGMGCPVFSVGNNFGIGIKPDSKEEADRVFNDLSAGGVVTMPLADAFWGGYFGMLTDKFGINWMVNYEQNSR